MDTPITKLRNLMTPYVNYISMWDRLMKMDESLILNESKQDKLRKLIYEERQMIKKNLPEILEILGEIPDDACDFKIKAI